MDYHRLGVTPMSIERLKTKVRESAERNSYQKTTLIDNSYGNHLLTE